MGEITDKAETDKENSIPEKKKKKTVRWHRWFGNLFRSWLKPLGVEVYTEFAVMAEPPEADIVIIRKKQSGWTPEQLKFVPDGVRDSNASHILLEFKYSESVNDDAFFQTGGYRVFYKQSAELKDSEIDTFLVSAKTPEQAAMSEYGYVSEGPPGVWRSGLRPLRKIP